MQQTKNPVAVAYYRVSTDQQGRSGLGLADQQERVRAFVAQRELALAGEFTEVESGKDDARPQLARALALARRKGGLVVVATLSRLGRRVSFVARLMESGTPFACADAPDDEPFILHVKASFAEEEARKISTRTKAALAVAKANGVKLGTPANLTLDAARKGAAANRARAAVAQDAVRPQVLAARARGLSIRAVAEEVGISATAVARMLAASPGA